MADDTARNFLKRFEKLQSARSTLDSHLQEIAELLLPRQASFTRGQQVEGEKRHQKIFEGQPPLALERFAAAMEAMISPRSSFWHNIVPGVDAMKEDQEAKVFYDEVKKAVFKSRYRTKANFASQQSETFMSLGAFGSGVMWVGETDDMQPWYKSVHLGECFFAENYQGFVDTVYRCYPMTARNIVKWFRRDGDRVPEKIRKAAEDDPFKSFDLVHVIQPRDDRDMGKLDRINMKFASVFIAKEEAELMHVGGENEFPYMVSRYVTAPGEVYGRGPGQTVLADVKMINEMSKETIVAIHQRNRPALLTFRSGALKKVSLRPGALNKGGLGPKGEELVKPINTGADPQIGEIGIERRQRTIDDAFLVNLMRVLQEHPNMTATQSLLLAQERGVVMGPTMGRQQSEALGPMIEREIAILERGGHLPDPPKVIHDMGGEFELEYDAPVNREQRAGEGLAIVRTLEQIGPLAQVQPAILDNYDGDFVARELAEINGAPPKMIRPKTDVENDRAARAQAERERAAIEAAPGVARAARDASEAAGGPDNLARIVGG